MKRLAVIGGVLLLLWWWVSTHVLCRPEVYQSMPVAQSDWVVERRAIMCPIQTGNFTIQARNTITHEIVVVAEQDDQSETTIVNDGPNHVVIRLLNMTPLRPIHDDFGPIHVTYDYQPHDDPEERAAYQRWFHDRRSPENIKWYCTHFMADLDQTNYDRFNESLAGEAEDGRKLYCQ